jgi:PAS domain S-box-containing protein
VKDTTEAPVAPRLHFRLAPEPAHLSRARERIRDYLQQFCADQRAIDDVVLCCEEAATNAIRYSASNDPMEIDLSFDGSTLSATVRDHGQGFEISTFDPTHLPDPELDHGRGLFLIAQLTDELRLSCGEGLTVRMVKREVARRMTALPEGARPFDPQAQSEYWTERRYSLLDDMHEAFASIDWQYRVTYANAAALEFFRAQLSEVVGRSLWELIPAVADRPVGQAIQRAMELGRSATEEYPAVTSGRWVEVRVYPTSSGVSIYLRDIEERKRRELERDELFVALGESERRVRHTLQSLLDPEGELADLELGDLIDTEVLQRIMDDFYALAQIPMSVVDRQGEILVGVGWQEICTRFHRVHPEAQQHCLESDLQLSVDLAPGEYRLYRCKNNMWDIATPIVVGGEKLGGIYSGQFFFEDETIDRKLFRSQAQAYGFDEEEYLAALDCVPRLSREAVERGMAFLLKLADTLSQLAFSNIKLARSLAERDRLTSSLQSAQKMARLGSWELDLTRNELTWSDEVFRIFGLEPQEFGATYEAFLERVHEDDREAVDDAYASSVREGRDLYTIEHRVVRKDSGEIRTVLERCQHMRDEAGQIVRSIGMVHDITESKQAEQALRQSEERFRALFEHSPDAVFLTRPDGSVEMANPAACRMYGYTEDEFRILGREGIMDTSDPQLHAALAEREAEGLVRGVELTGIRRGGERFPVEIDSVILAGEPSRSFVLHRDISERRLSEEKLARAQRRAELLAETAAALLASSDPQGQVEELCGVVMDELDCQAFFSFLTDEQAERLHLNAYAGIPKDEALQIEWLDYGVAVCGCAARDALRIVAEDIPNNPSELTDLVASYGITAYAAHPLLGEDRVLGTLSFGTRTHTHFSADDLDLMKAVADQVAIGLQRQQAERENVRLFEEQRDIAVTLQENFRHALPQVSGWEFGVAAESAGETALIGGDFHDVFVLSDDHLAVLIGDVEGKGIQAAGLTETVRSATRALALSATLPRFVLDWLNKLLLSQTTQSVTALFITLDCRSGTFVLASAGHPRPLQLHADGSIEPVTLLPGPPLGAFEESQYNALIGHLESGESLVLYTDGVTDVRRDGHFFGEDGVSAALRGRVGQAAPEIAEQLIAEVRDYADELRDDAQVLVIKWLPDSVES